SRRRNTRSDRDWSSDVCSSDLLSLTTNGVLLDRLAGPLVEAGLQRVNVSLDTLSHTRFAEITRRDALDRVLKGLAEAERYPELRSEERRVGIEWKLRRGASQG